MKDYNKKELYDKESLVKLMQQSCPQPQGDADFTERLMLRVRRDKEQREAACNYWQQQTGRPAAVTWYWRVAEWFMSPVTIVVSVMILLIISCIRFYDEIRIYHDIANSFLARMSEITLLFIPIVCCVIMFAVVGCTLALLDSREA